jgi:S1-C subfamily serine protease
VVKVTVGSTETGGRLGSGFLVDRRGRVLTNAHVVDDSTTATVTFDDGTESTAEVLGADESTDLAVLRVDTVPPDVAPLPLGRSEDLVVGDPVVAIGNPFGLERTATTGIVSALKRIITAPNGFEIQNVVQTDAAINEGNSGGPLLDSAGRVIGINSQIASEGGGNDGIGFAVPIDTIRPVADAIIASGRATHAWLGVTGRSITPAIARALDVPDVRGVAVIAVDDRGPAGDAGLRAATTPQDADVPRGGDLIVAVDGRAVEDMADVSRAVSSRAVGEPIALTVLRAGDRRTLRITLADRPDDVGVNPANP